MYLHDIKQNNTIITASADGKIGFVSADDIADLAFEALTDAKSHNTDHILTGPELLSHDNVHSFLSQNLRSLTINLRLPKFSDVLGRKITHTRISVGELKDKYIAFGLPEDFATMISSMDELNASGLEERIFGTPGKVAGKRSLRNFVENKKDSF